MHRIVKNVVTKRSKSDKKRVSFEGINISKTMPVWMELTRVYGIYGFRHFLDGKVHFSAKPRKWHFLRKSELLDSSESPVKKWQIHGFTNFSVKPCFHGFGSKDTGLDRSHVPFIRSVLTDYWQKPLKPDSIDVCPPERWLRSLYSSEKWVKLAHWQFIIFFRIWDQNYWKVTNSSRFDTKNGQFGHNNGQFSLNNGQMGLNNGQMGLNNGQWASIMAKLASIMAKWASIMAKLTSNMAKLASIMAKWVTFGSNNG